MKRLSDIVLSCLGLILFSPVLLLIAAGVKLASRGPVFYRGARAGMGGRLFRIWKFRTMIVDADKLGGTATADDDPRITRGGAFLRKRKLDELPQLLNILAGDMSLVGPRPEIPSYVERYSEEERAILQVRPGMTDWASIWNSDEGAVLSGSNDPTGDYERFIHPTKLKLQLKYARQRSLWIDLKILFYTAVKLVKKNWVPVELAPYGPCERRDCVLEESRLSVGD